MKSRHSRNGAPARTTGRVLLSSILLLYASTVMYMAALTWNAASFGATVSGAADNLFSATYDGRGSVLALADTVAHQSRMMTVALAVNVSTVAMFHMYTAH